MTKPGGEWDEWRRGPRPLSTIELRDVRRVNPEVLSVDHVEREEYEERLRRDREGEPQPLSATGTAAAVIVTLALAPFLQAVMASLGSSVGEKLARKVPRKLRRMLRRRHDGTEAALGGRSFRHVLKVEGTNVRISLPSPERDKQARAVIALSALNFDAFGDQAVGLWWDDDGFWSVDDNGTWVGYAPTGRGFHPLVHWDTQRRKWITYLGDPYEYLD